LELINSFLEDTGSYDIESTTCIDDAEQKILGGRYDLVFLDNQFLGQEGSGIGLMKNLPDEIKKQTKIAMVTGYHNLEILQEFIDRGGANYIKKGSESMIKNIEVTLKLIEEEIPKPKNPLLYILHGASGTGKSETIKHLKNNVPFVREIKKYATGIYAEDNEHFPDILPLKEEMIKPDWIIYNRENERVAINPTDIKEGLEEGYDCFFATGNPAQVRILQGMFPSYTLGMYIHPRDDNDWKRILEKRPAADTRTFEYRQRIRDEIIHQMNKVKYDRVMMNEDFFNLPLETREHIKGIRAI
jgi:guanylate kinase